MEKQALGKTRNGKVVYVDTKRSHAATHLTDTPELMELVKEALPTIDADRDNVYVDKDLGRIIGVSDLVATTEKDEIVYAKRLNRTNYTRFAMNRKPEPTQSVTVVLRKDSEGSYELWSAWIGSVTPQFPGDPLETPESRSFWRRHALVWGNQEVKPGTEITDWPWG